MNPNSLRTDESIIPKGFPHGEINLFVPIMLKNCASFGARQGKDREGDSQAGGHALAVGGSNLEGRNRRVADLHDFSKKPLDPDPNQQCFGKDEPGDQEKDPSGWQLPGRSIGPDAGVGQTQACRGYPVEG